MLKPHKHLNPELSVLRIGGLIIKALKANGVLKYDELLVHLAEMAGPKAKDVFLPSLSFLFLLGKLTYHQGIDSFELVQY